MNTETQDLTQSQDGELCLFCSVANGHTDTEILIRDDELLCFQDARPGARHHYLVIPRTHVGNCMTLRKEHVNLVERMEEMGKSALQRNKVTNLDDVRFGFHLPPFSSVPHLHLHVIAPASELSSRSLTRYGPQSCWFITVDKVLQQLRTMNRVK